MMSPAVVVQHRLEKEHNGLSEAGPLADKEEQLHDPIIVTCTRGEYYQKATRQR